MRPHSPFALGLQATFIILFGQASISAADLEATKAGGENELQCSIKGATFSVNGQATHLGKEQWKDPNKSWRTVGELIKSALPPADKDGLRPNVILKVDLDEQAPWGAAKALCMASSSLGVTKGQFTLPGKTAKTVNLKLPGGKAEEGEIVDFTLFVDAAGQLQVEMGAKRLPCNEALMRSMVKQLPKATIYVKAAFDLPAAKVVDAVGALQNDAKAADVAFLPVKDLADESAGRQESKDAVDRALSGGMGMGGKE